MDILNYSIRQGQYSERSLGPYSVVFSSLYLCKLQHHAENTCLSSPGMFFMSYGLEILSRSSFKIFIKFIFLAFYFTVLLPDIHCLEKFNSVFFVLTCFKQKSKFNSLLPHLSRNKSVFKK